MKTIDPIEILIDQYLNAKSEIDKRRVEVKLLLNYPNSKFTYEDPKTKEKYKIIIKDKVTVIPSKKFFEVRLWRGKF